MRVNSGLGGGVVLVGARQERDGRHFNLLIASPCLDQGDASPVSWVGGRGWAAGKEN